MAQLLSTQIGIGKSVLNIAKLFTNKPTGWEFHKAIYDTLFTQNAVWMQDVSVMNSIISGVDWGFMGDYGKVGMMTKGISALGGLASKITPTYPLLGFAFQPPKQFEILKYQYTEMPFVSRQVIANNQFKLPTELTLQGIRPIERGNELLRSFLTNWLGIKTIIEAYADAGGLWTIFTAWGMRKDYVLVGLNGNYVDGHKNAGVGWEFKFKQYNFDTMAVSTEKENLITKALGNKG